MKCIIAGGPDALRETLQAIDPDELTPKEALAALYSLRRLLEDPQ